MKRIVISDIHIGSKYYQGEALAEFLRSVDYDQLILAGDIIDFIRVPLFTNRAIQIAEAIDFSKEIIYIVGNHDSPLRGFIGKKAFGMSFVKRYEFTENNRKIRIEHGDQYDDTGFIHNNIIMALLSVSQNWMEQIFNINFGDLFTKWKIKRRKLRRIWDILKINVDVDVLITGHSHHPEAIIWILPDQKVHSYVNSGDWVSNKTYVEINDGVVRLKEYENSNN